MRVDPPGDPLADVSRETLQNLAAFEDLVRRWTVRINLVSPASLADMRDRHSRDSAQLLKLAPPDARHWVDLGAGAGFPGIVIAILAREQRPQLRLTLVESDARKAAFLATAARTLGLAIEVRRQRIEAPPFRPGDVVSARALAPLPRLLALAGNWRSPGALCLFPKGAGADQELTDARRCWHMDVERVASVTDAAATILRVGEFHRASEE